MNNNLSNFVLFLKEKKKDILLLLLTTVALIIAFSFFPKNSDYILPVISIILAAYAISLAIETDKKMKITSKTLNIIEDSTRKKLSGFPSILIKMTEILEQMHNGAELKIINRVMSFGSPYNMLSKEEKQTLSNIYLDEAKSHPLKEKDLATAIQKFQIKLRNSFINSNDIKIITQKTNELEDFFESFISEDFLQTSTDRDAETCVIYEQKIRDSFYASINEQGTEEQERSICQASDDELFLQCIITKIRKKDEIKDAALVFFVGVGTGDFRGMHGSYTENPVIVEMYTNLFHDIKMSLQKKNSCINKIQNNIYKSIDIHIPKLLQLIKEINDTGLIVDRTKGNEWFEEKFFVKTEEREENRLFLYLIFAALNYRFWHSDSYWELDGTKGSKLLAKALEDLYLDYEDKDWWTIFLEKNELSDQIENSESMYAKKLTEIPKYEQRKDFIIIISKKINEHGGMRAFLKGCQYNAAKIVITLMTEYKSIFEDVPSLHKNIEDSRLLLAKKAKFFIKLMYFDTTKSFKIKDIGMMTILPDYRIPAFLKSIDIIKEKDNHPHEREREQVFEEMRIASVYIGHIIYNSIYMNEKYSDDINLFDIDTYLWARSRESNQDSFEQINTHLF